MNRFSIFIITAIINTVSLFAERRDNHLIFESLDTKSGLNHKSITDITQDHQGFLWFGTLNGLHRFDGIDMKVFLHNKNDSTSISGNVIYAILKDKDANLWIATNSGLNKYNEKKGEFIRVGLQKKENEISETLYEYYVPSAVIDKEGKIIVSWGNHGLYEYNIKANLLEKIDVKDSTNKILPIGNITKLFVDSDNNLWMGSKSEGLFCLNPQTKITKNFRREQPNSISSNFIYAINEDQFNRLFISNEGGVDLYHKESEHFTSFKPKNKIFLRDSKWIWNINKDKTGELWFSSSRNGLYKVNSRTLEVTNYKFDETEPNTLNDNNIQCFFEDNQGNYWVGTQANGINYSLKNNSKIFNILARNPLKTQTLSNNKVTSIIESENSYVFIGTDGGGINIYDRRSNKYIDTENIDYKIQHSEEAILSLYIDSNDNLWSGGFLTGLNCYTLNGKKKSWKNIPNDESSLGHDDVRDVFEDSRNNTWICTNGGGLNLLNQNRENFKRFNFQNNENSISSDFTLKIIEDNKGFIWLGTYEGLDKIDTKSFQVKNYSSEQNLSGNWIYSLYIDSKKQLWIGTNMAIHKYNEKNDTFVNYNDSINLPGEIVSGILEDNDGNLWISTSRGLAVYNPQSKTTKSYFDYDGLPDNFFNPGAAFKNQKGELYFGTSKGLVFFDPKKISSNLHLPPVYITDISYAPNLNEKRHVFTGDTIILTHSQANSINFNYCALNYINPQKNSYEVKLEGFENNWKNIENQKFTTYTNLGPGIYKFRVRASNNDNYWNNDGDFIYLKIRPPFWRSTFAYILYSIAIILLLTFIRRYTTIRKTFSEKLKIQRIKIKKAEELVKLKSDLFINISHELSTPLTLILAPIEQMLSTRTYNTDLLNIIKKNTISLKNLVNEILDAQKDPNQISKIDYKYSDVVRFIKTITEDFSSFAAERKITIKFKSQIDSLIIPFAEEDLKKIINNLLSNAIKYNKANGKVEVDLSIVKTQKRKIKKFLSIKVTDTGIGIEKNNLKNIFERYYQVGASKKLSHHTGFGIGLYLTKQLVDQNKGIIQVESTPNIGTTFSVFIPCLDVLDELSSQSQKEIPQENASNIKKSQKPLTTKINVQKKHSILIAEDNLELSNLLRIILSENYRLSFASNGVQALEKIKRHHPDLLLTDILMPEMDGIELCENIKTNIITSHIPVIMLTALNTENIMIKGLTIGADDYVTKPFNPKVLQVRIQNLIDSRIKLQKKYITDLKTEPTDMGISSADELFFEKLHKIIDQNIENSEFSAESIASEMNMSNITLYRKIKYLTGLSINPFIRTIRLKRAASLLESNTMTVSEVAFAVGFSDVKYFRKCFYEHFQKNPSEFKKMESN